MNSRLLTVAVLVLSSTCVLRAQTIPTPLQSPPAAPANAPAATTQAASLRLTLGDAEKLALKNNPRIAVRRLLALVEDQVTRETRSIDYPTLTGNLTAVDAHLGSRITRAH